jgi:hypothetical protein
MEALGIQCNACGVKRRHKNLRYHPETFFAYCENPYTCNDENPNSPSNVIKRKGKIDMLTHEEAEFANAANIKSTKSDRIKRLLNSPLTVRIQSVDMAEFLVTHAENTDLTVSQLIRKLVEATMSEESQQQPETQPQKTPEPTVQTLNDDDLIF